MPCRFEGVIRSHSSTRAAVEFIYALNAHAPTLAQQDVKAWLKRQMTAVLSAIKQPPTVNDVQIFVGIAESEGLLFFSETCVLPDEQNISLT